MEKDKIRPLYSEFIGYLLQAPTDQTPYAGDDKPSLWNHYNLALDLLNKIAGEDFSRFKINPATDGSEGYVLFTTYRQKLSGLIAALHAKYFSGEPFPLGGGPSTIITQSQQQSQSFHIQMLLDIQSKIDGRNVSSRMRHFLQEFSVEPPRFLEAVC
jgi:hypothetical protein